jgi:phytoene dehydrogenase-like protein
MSEKTVVIIGAGIAGLAAGCYGRMNGYRTRIVELHDKPGGLCTAWTRKGYTIDGCIHWLTGSSADDSLYRVWEELGAVQGRRMLNHDVFTRFVGRDGRVLSLYTDVDRLERHLQELSPADERDIEELCGWIRKFTSLSFPIGKPRELMSAMDGLRLAFGLRRYLKDLAFLSRTPLGEYATRFQDPLLRTAISESIGRDSQTVGLIMTLAGMSKKAAGFPEGGSLPFAQAIERRYLDLGGEISYRSRAEKILERDGTAIGVRLADGSEIMADYVVSAADMQSTLFSLLDGRRVDAAYRELLDTGKLYSPCVQVSFGIRGEVPELADCLCESFQLEQPFDLAGRKVEWMTAKSYAFDSSLAPEGKSVVTSFLSADWRGWEGMTESSAAYKAEKEKIAAACAEAIDRRYPGFREKIEMTDVATPLTFHRYTRNSKGSFMTWILSAEFQRRHAYLRKTVPGLDNVFLASMWTNPPGGLPGAAIAGREVVQLLCDRDKKRFRTLRPATTG